jgi:hypothetical protein
MRYQIFNGNVCASARRRGALSRRAGNKYGAGLWLAALCLACASVLYGQEAGAGSTGSTSATAQSTGSTVPRLVNFSGVLKDSSGKALTGSVTLTLSLYTEQDGGSPLWVETQSVQPDDQGHYTLLLGATQPNGLPLDLFTSGTAQWLGIQPALPGAVEQPRVLLVGMPYALKAVDSDTLGGLPASAFLQAAAASQTSSASAGGTFSGTQVSGQDSTVSPLTLGGSGTTDYIPLWTNSTTLGSSVLFQAGTGSTAKLGLNTTTPATLLDVNGAGTVRGTLSLPATGTATASAGNNSQPASLQASAFNSSTSAAVNQTFNLKAEPTGNDTTSPSGKLNLLFASGTGAPAETGLSIASNGKITFATGQTFPGMGAGTISGVTAGTDLKGGGTSGTVTLNLDTTKVPQLAASNTFTGNQSVTGNVTATGVVTGSSFSGNGSGLTGVGTISGVTAGTDLKGGGTSGTVTLNLDTTKVPQLAASNTFTGNQSVTGNVTATGTVSGSSFSGSGSGLTNVNAVDLGNVPAADFPAVFANNTFTGLNTFYNTNFVGNGETATIGNMNCDPGSVGISFQGNNCTQYALLDYNGSTILNRMAGQNMSFREGNGPDQMTIVPGGGVQIVGTPRANSGTYIGNPTSLYVQDNTSTPIDDYLFYAFAPSDLGFCWIAGNGDMACGGSDSAVVPVYQDRMVALYAVESPENWFDEYGGGTLSDGAASVALEPTFAQTVNTTVEYHVFLTPKGDCEGLYVTNETPAGFEVHELRGGRSSVAFDYKIVAKRKGYENIRLADKTKMVNGMTARAAKNADVKKP